MSEPKVQDEETAQKNKDNAEDDDEDQDLTCMETFQQSCVDEENGLVKPIPYCTVSCDTFLKGMIMHDLLKCVFYIVFGIFFVTAYDEANLELETLNRQATYTGIAMFVFAGYMFLQMMLLSFYYFPTCLMFLRIFYAFLLFVLATSLLILSIYYSDNLTQNEVNNIQTKTIDLSTKFKVNCYENTALVVSMCSIGFVYTFWHVYTCYILMKSVEYLLEQYHKEKEARLLKRAQELQEVQKPTDEVNDLNNSKVDDKNNTTIENEGSSMVNGFYKNNDKNIDLQQKQRWELVNLKCKDSGNKYSIVMPGIAKKIHQR